MKTKLIIAIFGIAVTTHANAIPCNPQEMSNSIGYSGYQSSYIDNRCSIISYAYFMNDYADDSLCDPLSTKTLTVTEYVKDPDSSTAYTNSQLGNNNKPIYFFETCEKCESGYTRVQLARIEDRGKGSFYEIYGCGTCQGDNKWTISSPIESIKKCNTIDGSPTTEYQCTDGFYGTAANGNSSNCSKCPPVSGPTGPSCWGTSDAGYNTDITDCYLTPGTCTDMTGTFKINDYCDYTK